MRIRKSLGEDENFLAPIDRIIPRLEKWHAVNWLFCSHFYFYYLFVFFFLFIWVWDKEWGFCWHNHKRWRPSHFYLVSLLWGHPPAYSVSNIVIQAIIYGVIAKLTGHSLPLPGQLIFQSDEPFSGFLSSVYHAVSMVSKNCCKVISDIYLLKYSNTSAI